MVTFVVHAIIFRIGKWSGEAKEEMEKGTEGHGYRKFCSGMLKRRKRREGGRRCGCRRRDRSEKMWVEEKGQE